MGLCAKSAGQKISLLAVRDMVEIDKEGLGAHVFKTCP